jgi:hypothetical protein
LLLMFLHTTATGKMESCCCSCSCTQQQLVRLGAVVAHVPAHNSNW